MEKLRPPNVRDMLPPPCPLPVITGAVQCTPPHPKSLLDMAPPPPTLGALVKSDWPVPEPTERYVMPTSGLVRDLITSMT